MIGLCKDDMWPLQVFYTWALESSPFSFGESQNNIYQNDNISKHWNTFTYKNSQEAKHTTEENTHSKLLKNRKRTYFYRHPPGKNNKKCYKMKNVKIWFPPCCECRQFISTRHRPITIVITTKRSEQI